MKARTKICIVTLAIILVGATLYTFVAIFRQGIGPGNEDYRYLIAKSCYLNRTSAHDITIDCDGITSSIGPEVFAVGWDKEHLIAETHPLDKPDPSNPNCSNCFPDDAEINWWIVDLGGKKLYGPIVTREEFAAQSKAMALTDIPLQSIELAKSKGAPAN
jgi:hypothetical protein